MGDQVDYARLNIRQKDHPLLLRAGTKAGNELMFLDTWRATTGAEPKTVVLAFVLRVLQEQQLFKGNTNQQVQLGKRPQTIKDPSPTLPPVPTS